MTMVFGDSIVDRLMIGVSEILQEAEADLKR
jgi:hypothetical protein